MDTNALNTSESIVGQLQLKLDVAEKHVVALQKEKQEMVADFEFKRTKIKELYFAKETTIRELNAKLLEAGRRVSELECTVTNLQEEIENVKMIASVSENTKEEAVEDLNKHHQEEIESLRRVLQDSMEEQRNELFQQFEEERRRWEKERLRIENERDDTGKLLAQIKEETSLKNAQLGLTMEAAESEAATLKAVVIPLESEISELKAKLATTEKSLEMERQAQKDKDEIKLQGNLTDNDFSTDTSDHADSGETDDLLQDLHVLSKRSLHWQESGHSISLRKSSHGDLEQYIDVLSKQKLVLQEENDLLKAEMHEVCRSLEQEITSSKELKRTWEAANEHFLLCQMQHLKDMEIVQEIVSLKQWKKIEDGLKNEAHKGNQQTTLRSNETELDSSSNRDAFSQTTCDLPLSESETSIKASPSCASNTYSTTLTDFQDDVSLSSVASLPSPTNPTFHETVSAQRVLSAPHLHSLECDDVTELHSSKGLDEIPVDSSLPPEAPHCKPPSGHMKRSVALIESLNKECSRLKEELVEQRTLQENEKSTRRKLEGEIALLSSQSQKQIKELREMLTGLEKRLSEDRAWRKRKETEDDKRLATLQKDREQIYMDYLKLKKENDNVKSYYDRHRVDLAKEQMPVANVEILQGELQRCRQALLAAQVEKSHVESSLQSQLSFAKDSLSAEQIAKDEVERTLSADLDAARRELHSLQSVKIHLDREMTARKELEIQLDRTQLSADSVRTKSKGIINEYKEKLKAESTSKEELEMKLQEARNQVRSLQDALETSEHVQQDFVRLSQSLQMRLEEVRLKEEEKEIADRNNLETSPDTDITSPNHNPD